MNHFVAVIAVILTGLSTVNCSNLQAEGQSLLCSAQLLGKMTNNLNTSVYLNAFNDLSVKIAGAPNAQTVVDHLASYPNAYRNAFFAYSQAIYQAEIDYDALSPEIIAECDQQLDYAYCASTCFNSYPTTPDIVQDQNCSELENCNTTDPCGQVKRLRSYLNYSDFGGSSQEYVNELWSFSLDNPFQNIEVCFQNMPNAFAQHNCETQYIAITNLIMQSVSVAGYVEDISTTPNVVLQLQKTYLLSRFKFGHDVARISMACRSFLAQNQDDDL